MTSTFIRTRSATRPAANALGKASRPFKIVCGDTLALTPHMGWNSLNIKKDDPLLQYIKAGDYVYFVHSYYARSGGEETLAWTEYGEAIPAVVRSGNVIGFQFHPEKSSDTGASLLKALKEVIS